MHILVTGGTGYIGSHTVVELVQEGHSVVVVDNLVNSSEEALRRVAQIVGQTIPFVKVDLCDPKQVEALFAEIEKRSKTTDSTVLHDNLFARAPWPLD